MTKKSSNNNPVSDYILVILLLVCSGNPIMRFLDKSALMILAILILLIKHKYVKKDFFLKFLSIASALLALFALQDVVLHFVSWLGAFRYISTFLFGGLIFYLVSERFSFRFFVVLYYFSLISLVLFVVVNLLNIHIPGLIWGNQRSITYIVYTFVESHHYRNCGMFWEPGAFAGILTLCLAFNARDLPALWKNHKLKVIVLIVALLTTKSTTGYIVFFMIVIYYLAFFIKNHLVKFVLIPTLVLTGVIVYGATDFLQEKITTQAENSASLYKGEFSNSRFGSFILDMHYVKKHPIIGNGLNEKTRYADDPLVIQLIQAGENIGNANGFSNFLACMGIPFMFFYLLIIFKAIGKIDTKVAFLVIFVIMLSLWGEQWLNYPMYTGMLFVHIKRYVKNQQGYSFNHLS